MKKILLLLLFLAALTIPKKSNAQAIWPAATGDSLRIEFQCLDSVGNPIACDSVFFSLYRYPTSGNRVLVDSGRTTTMTEGAIGTNGKTSLLQGRDSVYTVSVLGNATVGYYKLSVKAYGGTYNAKTLRAGNSRWFIVGAATTTNYAALSDAQRWNTVAVTGMPMPTYTQPTGFLAATFPTGTIANTTNITAGTITTTTNLTNEARIVSAETLSVLTNEARLVSAETLSVLTNEARVVSTDTLTTILGNVNGSVGSVTGEVRVNSIDTLAQITNEVRVVSTDTLTTLLGNVNGSVDSVKKQVAVGSGDTISVDWGNVIRPTSVVGLTGTRIDSVRGSTNPVAVSGTVTVGTNNDKTGYTLSQTEKNAIFDTLSVDNPLNLVRDAGFESRALSSVWWQATATANIVTNGTIKSGRKVLRLSGASAKVVSDTIRLLQNERVIIGGDMLTSDNANGLIQLETAGGILKQSAVTQSLNVWQRIMAPPYLVTASGTYRVALINGAAAGDTSRFDNIFLYAVPDTAYLAGGSTDSGLVARIGKRIWGVAVGVGSDSTTVAQRTVTGGSGSVTVNFSAGAGNRTVTITTKDSAAVPTVDAGVIVSVYDSTSSQLKGNLPANQSGITTFSLNDGGYYIKNSKTGFRPIYGSSPSPQDSIYLRVSGNTTRTDTIVTVAQILPVVANRTNFYGYIQDIQGDSLIDGVEILMELDNPPGNVKCCAVDVNSTVLIPKFFASTKPNVSGRFEFNLFPTAQLLPSLKYKLTEKINGTTVKVFNNITVSGTSQRFNP